MSATLILNANWQPLSWLPLSVNNWQQAIKLQFMERIEIIEYYEDWVVHSPSTTLMVPALAITKDYHAFKKGVRFSRVNMYLRDLYQCQYCAEICDHHELTIDHVIPRAKGGKTNWENCVAACVPCNQEKKDNYQKPIREPFKPDYWHLSARRKSHNYEIKHPSWVPFLT